MNGKLAAGFPGTFWLVFGDCGSAIFAAKFPEKAMGERNDLKIPAHV